MSLIASEAWLESFVPRLVLTLGDQLAPGDFTVIQTDAVVLIADIVSFTPYSVERAARGRRGQAELSAALDHCVALVAEQTFACRGELVGFAGDSMISIFSADTGPVAWERAQRCAQLILRGARPQRTVPQEISVAPVSPPNMRLGLAGGTMRLLVTRPSERSYAVLLGAPVVAAARAQAGGRPGAIAVDAVLGPEARLEPSAVPDPDATAASIELLESFAVAPVIARSRAGHTEWLAEIRPVTSLFVSLLSAGNPVDEPRQVAHAAGVIDSVLRLHGASIDQIVHDDKGTVLWATFGANIAELGDRRGERAVRAGIAICNALPRSGLSCDVGIATGESVVGTFGDAAGRVFAVVGPHVNLAARLMQAARGQVLVDDLTLLACGDAVRSDSMTMRLKGIDGRVTAHVVSRLEPTRSSTFSRRSAAEGEMVGRERELEMIVRELDAFTRTKDAVAPVAVIGEAGIGKTTVIDAVARHAGTRGIGLVEIAGDPIAARFPMRALNSLVAEPADPSHGHRRTTTETLQSVVAAERSAGPALTGEEASRALDSVAAVLNERLPDGRLLVTMRDAHWVDDISLRVFERLLTLTDRIFLILECRPDVVDPDFPVGEFLGRTSARRVELRGLDVESLGTLAQRWLGVKAVSSELVRALATRAGGNPFFVQQLTTTMSQAGYVTRHGDVAQLLTRPSVESLAAVPSTIHDALSNRIDRLDPDALLALKAASVLGLSFETAAVRAIHPVSSRSGEVPDALWRLAALDLIEPVADGAESFRFRHALYREVTYSMLTQPQRTAAHSAAAVWIEQQEDSEDALELLAHHWTQADVADRAVPLLTTCARRSAEIWSGLGTIEWITTAQRLAARERLEIDPRQRGEWDLLLGQAYRGAGEMARADRLLADGLGQLSMTLPASAPRRLWAITREVGQQLATRLATSRRLGRLVEEQAHLTVVINAYRALSIAAFSNDDLLQMALVNLRILNLVEAAGLESEHAVHYSMAQLASACAGARWPALYYRRLARQAREVHPDSLTSSHSRTYDANFLIGDGNFAAARRQLDAAERHYNEVAPGSYIVDLVLSLQGYVDYFTGRFNDSAMVYRRLYQSGVDRGDPAMVAWGLNGQAMCRLAQGEDELVLEHLETSRDLPMERLAQIAWHSFYARASARLSRLDKATDHAETAGRLLFAQRATVAVLQPEYCALAEVALHLRRSGSGAARSRAAELHRRVLREFARLERRFAVARPMYHVVLADYHRYRGKEGEALSSYHRGMALARRLGMAFEEGLARFALRPMLVDAQTSSPQAALRDLGVKSVSLVRGPSEVEYRSLSGIEGRR